jgi:hypothetical protein
MYYRLLAVDAVPLPTLGRWAGREHLISRGGLLLEPPTNLPFGMLTEGYAVLCLFSGVGLGVAGRVGSMAEAYRWLAPGELEISDRFARGSLRFRGRATGADLLVTSGPEDRFLPAGTTLQLVEAPDDPISEDWRDTLDFGPGWLVSTPGSAPPSPEMIEAFRASVARMEPLRQRGATERLERAWRAPA